MTPPPKPAADAEPSPASDAPAPADHWRSGPWVRQALLGAGTSVWEWDLHTDRIAGFDDGTALLGYAAGEIDNTQQGWNGLIHPDDLAENHAAFLRHAAGQTASYESEYRARARNGAWHWVSERGSILEWTADHKPRRLVGTVTHIEQRKRIEGTADELLNRLQQIARSAPGVLFQFLSTPEGGRFLYVSERSTDLMGVSPECLVQDSSVWRRLIVPEDRKRIALEALEAIQLQTAEPRLTEYRIEHPRTGLRHLRATSIVGPSPEGSALWHGYIEDITETRLLEQLREEASAARAANRAKTEFLSRMSHELRTPLNAVLGFAQLLEMDTAEPLSKEQRRRVAFIREAGAHLLQMISELLDLTRIESGQMSLTLEPLAPAALLQESVEMLRPQAGAASVQLLVAPADAGLCVHADRTRLKQVLINLVSNAVKYNRRGGSVLLSLEAEGSEAAIRVADTGVGIAPQDMAHLFEPFNRLAHVKSTIEGTGIGLAVTKRLVELMNGRIEVQSAVGQGSTFSVVLPVEPSHSCGSTPAG